MPFELYSTDQIPKQFLPCLGRYDKLMRETNQLEEILKEKELCEICQKLDKEVLSQEIIGIHYTRAIRADIEKDGLILIDGNEWRRKFLIKNSNIFTKKQQLIIQNIWQSYFDGLQTHVRDKRISFNFTFCGLKNNNAKPLLEYYGGEQIYMPLTDEYEIANIIKKLGEPLVLKCVLKPNQINTFKSFPWGRIWISSYHRSINANAECFDQDGYQKEAVPPKAISILSPAEALLLS